MEHASKLKDLGQFIRLKRNSISPETYSLPYGKRKTPGLRREEVSILSGISVSLYTLIEQGQYDHPSVDVLEAIARTLKMTTGELNHMLFLSDNAHLKSKKPTGKVSETIKLYLNDLSETSSIVLDAYWNILYANNNFLENLVIEDINMHFIELLFDNSINANIENLTDLQNTFISVFRYKTSAFYHDKVFQELLQHLLTNISEFNDVWEKHEIESDPKAIHLITNTDSLIARYDFLPIYPVTDSDLIIFNFIKKQSH